ncbi:hypothetical protein A3G55_03745 [Candidatus Giovannonibacteria bacterium RIFCSPLOWO2_12_FULL_44_25]|uniref:Nucleotidyltransferase n=2 Tax=Candidatus Giovannoniibacteriota TaxID=1752738 RepID=A0A1F5W9S2_9BACT|nr:MAG: Nucleotidyltransferase substrate binding protein, HI0074 family [Parcubacteria group bacterium GW2011_GWC1_44_10]KKT60352.1 MAG: Nucleotidyltransferase substrate binding protein, HI0074 family [Candidatus Giovannonibacteria bacterium GW2011_GWA1_44_25]KKU29448.1 MAG: Nucleotidyltransferase substrate binding protein, HI0074 family [Candidatus Giovannonibacteria bacterium GW2011_GWB1_46_20]OGF50421.1 MAG: hypothetical protein A2120_02130 [Candidatus Giovannonibacteria bacterium GWA2_45_15]
MTKFESIREDFENALKRFEEILQERKNDIVRDSAIKRFELVFDLLWKTLKAFLEDQHSATCVSPQSCFREAFRLGVIDYNDGWIDVVKTRNNTVHAYDAKLADEVYAKLPAALSLFKKLKDALQP